MHAMQDDTWHITARYRSFEVSGSVPHVARAVINLVNVQGPGTIAVAPPCLPALAEYIDRLDPAGTWRSWWAAAAGQQVELVDIDQITVAPPCHPLPKTLARSGRCLGINVGGHYLRLAWLTNGVVEHSATIRLGSGRQSVLARATVNDFVNMVESERCVTGLTNIGIAWSAPRTPLGLRAMSILMDNAGELTDLMHSGRIDAVLTERFDVPVFSWNDGEAVVAAELMAGSHDSCRPLLALKLGTSMASGVATADGVSALPLQLAKFVLAKQPQCEYEHPQIGLFGTARDLIGAESILSTYRTLMAAEGATYEDFCKAAVAGVPIALRLVRDAADAITEITSIISGLWSPVDVVVTGKNLEREDYRSLFTREVCNSLSTAGAVASLREPGCDHGLVAAIGAVYLSIGSSAQLHRH